MWSVASHTCTSFHDAYHHYQCLATLPQSQSPKCNGWTLILASKFAASSFTPAVKNHKAANPSRTNKGSRKSYSRAWEDENMYSNFVTRKPVLNFRMTKKKTKNHWTYWRVSAHQTFCAAVRVKVDRNLHQLSKAFADTHFVTNHLHH